MIYDLIYSLVGFLVMFGLLVGIGINKPRGISVKTWCYGYLTISIIFDVLVVFALVNPFQYVWLTNLLLGVSAGAATGLGIHVAHHISEEGEHEEESPKAIFGL